MSPNNLGLVLGMAIDVEANQLYFSDRESSKLYRIALGAVTSDGSGRDELLGGVCAWGMAFDWINKALYWSEER